MLMMPFLATMASPSANKSCADQPLKWLILQIVFPSPLQVVVYTTNDEISV